jgi:hypothetical protein
VLSEVGSQSADTIKFYVREHSATSLALADRTETRHVAGICADRVYKEKLAVKDYKDYIKGPDNGANRFNWIRELAGTPTSSSFIPCVLSAESQAATVIAGSVSTDCTRSAAH